MNITKKELQTDGVEYTGIIYNNSEEYIALLMDKYKLTEEQVLDRICQGIQALNLTRVAQNLCKTGKLEEGQEVEVMTLYGERTTNGPTKKQLATAKSLLDDKFGEDEYDHEMVEKVALKIKAQEAEEKARKAEALKALLD